MLILAMGYSDGLLHDCPVEPPFRNESIISFHESLTAIASWTLQQKAGRLSLEPALRRKIDEVCRGCSQSYL